MFELSTMIARMFHFQSIIFRFAETRISRVSLALIAIIIVLIQICASRTSKYCSFIIILLYLPVTLLDHRSNRVVRDSCQEFVIRGLAVEGIVRRSSDIRY